MSRFGPDWSVRFVCTDRGTHPSRELGNVFRHLEDPAFLAEVIASHGETNGRRLYEAGMFGYSHGRAARRGGSVDAANVTTTPIYGTDDPRGIEDSWFFPCPTCGRELRLSAKRMRQVATKLHDAGLTSVDVSLLDAML